MGGLVMNRPTPFWDKPLASLDRGEWEFARSACSSEVDDLSHE